MKNRIKKIPNTTHYELFYTESGYDSLMPHPAYNGNIN